MLDHRAAKHWLQDEVVDIVIHLGKDNKIETRGLLKRVGKRKLVVEVVQPFTMGVQ